MKHRFFTGRKNAQVFLCALALSLGLTPIPARADGNSPRESSLAPLVRQYDADRNSVHQFYNVPWSDTGFDRREKLCREWLDRLNAVDFEQLGQEGRVDFVLLRNELERAVGRLKHDRKILKEIEQLIPFRALVAELEQARWLGREINGRETASQIDALARQVKTLKARVEKGRGGAPDSKKDKDAEVQSKQKKEEKDAPPIKVEAPVALRASEAAGELRERLKDWLKYHDGYKPALTWWVKQPCEEALKQLEEYAKYLKEEAAGQKGKDDDPLVGSPIGEEALSEGIRREFLPYSAKELVAIGEEELARGEREMKAAAHEMGCGDDWKAALDKVKNDYAAPGEQDRLIESIGRESIDFARKNQFVTVPPLCEETWRLTMTPPDLLKSMPYAAYNNQHMLAACASQGMKQEDKLMVMRGNNKAFVRNVTPHELIPGHHLQLFTAARYNTHREIFTTPFYVEGWALYCELRYKEMGWTRTPEEKIAAIFWRMTRAARIVVSLKYHLGRMKPAEMVDFLKERVGHEEFGATSEVRRFIGAAPLYQTGYLIGGLQFDALRRELVRPGGMTEQTFHDAALREGPMPLEILRAALLHLPIARDAKPCWKFHENAPRTNP